MWPNTTSYIASIQQVRLCMKQPHSGSVSLSSLLQSCSHWWFQVGRNMCASDVVHEPCTLLVLQYKFLLSYPFFLFVRSCLSWQTLWPNLHIIQKKGVQTDSDLFTFLFILACKEKATDHILSHITDTEAWMWWVVYLFCFTVSQHMCCEYW